MSAQVGPGRRVLSSKSVDLYVPPVLSEAEIGLAHGNRPDPHLRENASLAQDGPSLVVVRIKGYVQMCVVRVLLAIEKIAVHPGLSVPSSGAESPRALEEADGP